MSTLTFKDSPVGRAAKNALEHLLADHRNNEFTYADFPPVPQEFLDYMADELKEASRTPGMAVMNAENVEQWANSEIIGPLKRAGYVDSAGYHTFVFTENGKSIDNIELEG